jgi:hypothetical protein
MKLLMGEAVITAASLPQAGGMQSKHRRFYPHEWQIQHLLTFARVEVHKLCSGC